MPSLNTLIKNTHPLLKGKDSIVHPMNEIYEIIIHHVPISKAKCIACPETIITQQEYDSIICSIQQRKEGRPLAYILRKMDFYGRSFFVNESVLIPRPESEQLVDIALTFIKRIEHLEEEKTVANNSPAHTCTIPNMHTHVVLDCGTGSGCIGLSIAAELHTIPLSHHWTYVLSDISEAALSIAKKNKRVIYPEKNDIQFIHGALLHAIDSNILPSIIVANLPYVSPISYSYNTNTYEPECALNGSIATQVTCSSHMTLPTHTHNMSYDDGTAIIRQLLQATSSFSHSHILLIEADPMQMDIIAHIATSYSYPIQGIFHDTFLYPRFFYCAKYQSKTI